MAVYGTLAFLLAILGFTYAEQLPSYMQSCHKTSPNLNECIKELILSLKPHLSEGIPEMSIPPMEPLHFDKLLDSKSIDPLEILKLSLHDVTIYGITNFKVCDVDLDLDKKELILDLSFYRIVFDGAYNLKGKLMKINIDSSGRAEGNIVNLDSNIKIQYDIKTIDGAEYIKINNATLNASIGGGSVKMNNLFPGRRILSKIAEKIINRKFNKYANKLARVLETKFSKPFVNFSNKICAKYTYNEILPE